MPKAVLVRWEEEYLPGMSLAELEETHRREPPGKSRDRLQAAVPRKRYKMLAEIAAISGRHPSTIHIIRRERNRLVHHEGDPKPAGAVGVW